MTNLLGPKKSEQYSKIGNLINLNHSRIRIHQAHFQHIRKLEEVFSLCCIAALHCDRRLIFRKRRQFRFTVLAGGRDELVSLFDGPCHHLVDFAFGRKKRPRRSLEGATQKGIQGLLKSLNFSKFEILHNIQLMRRFPTLGLEILHSKHAPLFSTHSVTNTPIKMKNEGLIIFL